MGKEHDSLKVDYEIYKEKIMPYLEKNKNQKDCIVSGTNSTFYPLNNGKIEILPPTMDNKVVLVLDKSIKGNKKVFSDLEKLTGGKFN